MNSDNRLVIPEQVMARQVGEDYVMLDLEKGAYYGLDPVGARVWQLIGEGKSLVEICDALVAEFDVPRDELERDVNELVDELAANGLVRPK